MKDIWWDEGEVFRQIGPDTFGPFKTEREAEEFEPEENRYATRDDMSMGETNNGTSD